MDPLPLLFSFPMSTKQRSEATGTFIWHLFSVLGLVVLSSLSGHSHLFI
jgi:hypothetical protein